MTKWIVSAILLLVGVLNITPAIAFFAPERTVDLYGLSLVGEDISILTRHRAVLLGLLGAAMIFAAIRREVTVPVIVGALVGKAAFLYLVYSGSGYSAEIGRVAAFDVGAVILLVIALVLYLVSEKKEWTTR